MSTFPVRDYPLCASTCSGNARCMRSIENNALPPPPRPPPPTSASIPPIYCVRTTNGVVA
eukprot:scaffold294050_cov14-Prasinocladus_malaysianus.AAC.1